MEGTEESGLGLINPRKEGRKEESWGTAKTDLRFCFANVCYVFAKTHLSVWHWLWEEKLRIFNVKPRVGQL